MTGPRVLLTTSLASPLSGAFHMLVDMARETRKRGFETFMALPAAEGSYPLLTSEERERTYFYRLPHARAGQPPGYHVAYVLRNIESVLKVARLIRREHIAVVHANEVFDVYAGVAAKLVGAGCVWHVRAELSPWPALDRILPRVTASLADTILSVSESVRQEMFLRQGIGAQKVVIMHEPEPDPERFHVGADGSGVRTEFAPDGSYLVGLVAKFSWRKGHDVLVRAAPLVLERFPNTRFLLVGGELSGPRHQEHAQRVRQLVEELGLRDKVLFAGYRSDVPQVMAACDVLAHCPTYPDPFPGVILQGMGVGRPYIASDLGGAREQIVDGVTGFLVPPGDPIALAQAINTLLGDGEKRKSFGEAASKRLRTVFARDAFYEKLCREYRRVLPEGRV